MGRGIVTLNEGLYTVSSAFYESVQIFMLILLAIICLLMVILVAIHLHARSRVKSKLRLKRNIAKTVKEAMSSKSTEQSINSLITKSKIFSRRGLATISEVLDAMDEENQKKLRDILIKMKCGKYLAEQLKSDNEDFLAEIIRLAAELNLVELVDDIERVMVLHAENINVQYEAFLALSKLGSYDSIVNICIKKDFPISLTFRSLQEVISAYSGDKSALYKALLKSNDAYVVRVCVRLIGNEKIKEHAPSIEGFLDEDNINLLIDTMRALSNIQYKPVMDKLAGLMKHERWEVRSAAVNAVAAMDTHANVDNLVLALQDSEWQVRFNAGVVLGKVEDSGIIRDKVAASGDKFAMDMFESFVQLANIGRA